MQGACGGRPRMLCFRVHPNTRFHFHAAFFISFYFRCSGEHSTCLGHLNFVCLCRCTGCCSTSQSNPSSRAQLRCAALCQCYTLCRTQFFWRRVVVGHSWCWQRRQGCPAAPSGSIVTAQNARWMPLHHTNVQRAMLNAQVSLRGKSIKQWWAWYVYS
jgi:hypothetical protein